MLISVNVFNTQDKNENSMKAKRRRKGWMRQKHSATWNMKINTIILYTIVINSGHVKFGISVFECSLVKCFKEEVFLWKENFVEGLQNVEWEICKFSESLFCFVLSTEQNRGGRQILTIFLSLFGSLAVWSTLYYALLIFLSSLLSIAKIKFL